MTTGGRWWRWPGAPQPQVTAACWKPHCWLILQLELEHPYTFILQGEIMIDVRCFGAMVMTTNSWAWHQKKFRQKLMLLTCSLCKDYFSLYPPVSRSIVVTGKNIQLWNIHLCFHPWTTVRDNHILCRSWVVLLLKLVAMLSKGRLSQISQCCFMQRLRQHFILLYIDPDCS